LGLGLLALGAGRFGMDQAAAAPADGALFGEQAEWVQKYDSDARLSVPRTTTPILSSQTIATTEQAVALYQDLVARGGWNNVPNQTMKVGSKGPAIVALRQRLMITGDLDEAAGTAPTFDSYVEAGVKRFQARHGISATGVVAQQTIAALNVPAQVRVRQLEINLVRLCAFSGNLGSRFVTMNIPGASVETVEGGMVVTHHQAGVGKIDRQSPVMQAKAVEINFNPFWTVPASIIR
jgi:murein L,D-transpeptidase YcbB/YkuD